MINELINKLFSVFEDIEKVKRVTNTRITPVTDKPDFIDQDVWDMFYIKPEHDFVFKEIFYIQVNDVFIGYASAEAKHCFVCFKENKEGSLVDNNLLANKVLLSKVNTPLEFLYKAACDYYGKDNVTIGTNMFSTVLGITNSVIHSFSLFIYHGKLTVRFPDTQEYDMFGGFTVFHFRRDGSVYYNPYFTNIKRDAYLDDHELTHPHTARQHFLTFSEICTGSGSPINSAKSAFIEDANEDTAYAYLLTYDNLIQQQASQGVPYYYFHQMFLNNVGSDNTRMSYADLLYAVKQGHIKPQTHVSHNRIFVVLKEEDINEYIAQHDEGEEVIIKSNGSAFTLGYHEIDRHISYKNNAIVTIKNRNIEPEVIPSDMSYLRLNDMFENEWRKTSKIAPTQSDIKKLEEVINSELTKHAINHFEEVNYEANTEYNKELLGLTKIHRGTSVEDIPELAEAS